MFSDEACATPCPRFVLGATDPDTDMIQCAKCGMWFIDDESIEESDAR